MLTWLPALKNVTVYEVVKGKVVLAFGREF